MNESSHITTSGGLLTQAFIDSIRESSTDRPHTEPAAFGVPWESAPATDKKLEDDVAGAWELLKERWDSIHQEVETLNELDVSTTRQRWLLPLLQLLDFDPQYQRKDLTPTGDEDLRFDVSHRGWNGAAGNGATDDGPALHLLAPGQDLDQRQDSGRGPKAKSPHDMLQVFLNVSEPDLWAVLSNGRVLRLLRDYHHTFSKGYVQFDLESIFEGRNYADFRALYRLCHASRFRPTSDAEEATLPLEDFHQTARATGVKIGEDLRPQVRDAIEHLGNGFLQGEPALIEALQGDPDAARDFYSEILRVVYRILFLLFAEQRGLVPDADAPRSELYWSDYSLTALREEAEGGVPERDDYTDLWHGLHTTFRMVRDGAEELGVFGYNGELFDLSGEDYLEGRACDNARLLRAVRALTLIEREGVLQRISYLDLGVEELGSIYEALLDYTPRVTEKPEEIEGTEVRAHTFVLDPRGLERKQSGSYYTPDSLVNELIKSALLPVMRDRLQDAGLPVVDEDALGEVTTGLLQEYAELTDEQRKAGEEALLSMTVCDPAAGSGHFLVKANDVLGAEVARLRSGDEYPTERRIREAKREVLARCIYAVDLNPMAVELCKVSLWINASVDNRPLNFLDHHIKCGNSLIGATPEVLEEGVPFETFPMRSKSRSGDDGDVSQAFRDQNRKEQSQVQEGGLQLNVFQNIITDPQTEYNLSDIDQVASSKPSLARERYEKWESSSSRQDALLVADAWTAAFFWSMPEGTKWAPTTGEILRLEKEGKDAISARESNKIREIAADHRFFHWHLEFPDVFGEDGGGGFDVVLGNPPWERTSFEDIPYFLNRKPEIANAPKTSDRESMIEDLADTHPDMYEQYLYDKRRAKRENHFFSASGRYENSSKGRTNTYALFTDLSKSLISESARSGIVVPTGLATDTPMQDFWAELVDSEQIASLYDFENKGIYFPNVHNSYKFCLLTITGKDVVSPETDFGFFVGDVQNISGDGKTYSILRSELEAVNPNTKQPPVCRSRRDLDLLLDLQRRTELLDRDFQPWVGLTSSSSSTKWKEEGSNPVGAGMVKMYESKLMNKYDHRFSTYEGVSKKKRDDSSPTEFDAKVDSYQTITPRYTIEHKEVRKLLQKKGCENDWILSYRDVARSTDEHTLISSVIPFAGPMQPLNGITADSAISTVLCLSNANSIEADWATRQKTPGIHVNVTICRQLPFISVDRYGSELLAYIVPRVMELTYTAWDLAAFADDVWSESSDRLQSALESQWQENVRATDGGHRGQTPPDWVEHSDQADESFPHPPFMWDEERRAHLRADLDGLYGHLYGLNRDELAYILDTFPIVKRKDEEEYGEYRTKRLVLEAYDRLTTTDLVDSTPSASGDGPDHPYSLSDADLHDLDDDADPDGVHDDFADLQRAVNGDPPALGEGDTTTTTSTSPTRSEAFRVGVRRIYEHRCAVCGVDARGPGDGSPIVDAAHIVPKSDGGPDDLRNGLCLCKNHHWAFDQGWFSITDDLTVCLHPDLPENEDYDFIREHDGETLHLPEDERFWPAGVYVAGRREMGH